MLQYLTLANLDNIIAIIVAVLSILSALFEFAGKTGASKTCGTISADLGRVVRWLRPRWPTIVGIISAVLKAAKRTPPAALALAFALPLITGCVGTLEESRGQLRLGAAAAASAPRASSLDARCQTLSDREYWFGGVAQGGAVLTGASGISTLPLEDRWETAAAAATLGVATVTAAAVYFERQANSSYVDEGCGR